MRSHIVSAFMLLSALPLVAQDQPTTGAGVYDVMTGRILPDATILVKDGRIAAVGSDLRVPDGVPALDAEGLVAYPGFIDAWTSLGLSEIRSVAGSVDTREMGDWNAHLRADIAVNPHSAHIPVARVNGITTAVVVPGGGTLPGQVAILDLLGRTVPEMLVDSSRPLRVLRLPSPPRRTYAKKDEKGWKEKREKSWKELEEMLGRARRLQDLWGEGVRPVLSDVPGQERLSLEATARHIQRGDPWMVWVDGREQIVAALDFAKKHDLHLILAGLEEGWKVADRLKEAGHDLLLGAPFSSPGRDEPYDTVYANAAALHEAGLKFGMVSNSSSDVRNLPYEAAMAVSFGLPREEALRAITLHAAAVLGIDDTYGAIEKGKVANIVLYDGDPLDARESPRHVFIRGRAVPLTSRHTRLAEPYLGEH